MKFTALRTKSGKYSGRDHNGDLYFTDDEDIVVEYEYEVQDFVEFLFEYEYTKEVITSLIKNLGLLEEEVIVEYTYEVQDYIDFLITYKDEHTKEVITIFLIENPGALEELVEEYADEFAKWLDKEREE